MLRIGTCSWKYDSWRGIIYSDKPKINYLQEYSKKFNTVEIDQWFWSLFEPGKVVLPSTKTASEYDEATPKDFLFTIKVPNSLTLTHFYKKGSNEELKPNPYFLSHELFTNFLQAIKPIQKKTGCLIFQFEYLNKQKMASLSEFQSKLKTFFEEIDKKTPPIGIEIRNPNYLKINYFKFLADYNIIPVLLEGYYMPPVIEVYNNFKNLINRTMILRLHGPDRKGIEKLANDNWNKIYVNRDREISSLTEMIKEITNKEVDLFVNVNNHFEGSAPLTIEKIRRKL